ncbi:hypothetical protein LCGC14_1507310 [marine sediment metagenome]|uniref:Uncharacterized protein n=1 Tax=marine sediment metagenome TaxID=412755 RepID=A0A0F9JN69_9ZZZZ
MKIYYTTDFVGHTPIGTSAVIVAQNKGHARRLLAKELENYELKLEGFLDCQINFEEIDPTKAQAIVLSDGDY